MCSQVLTVNKGGKNEKKVLNKITLYVIITISIIIISAFALSGCDIRGRKIDRKYESVYEITADKDFGTAFVEVLLVDKNGIEKTVMFDVVGEMGKVILHGDRIRIDVSGEVKEIVLYNNNKSQKTVYKPTWGQKIKK